MPFPEVSHCLVCDGIRREERGKLTILGFLGVSPYVSIEVSTLAIPLPLGFVLLGGPGEGRQEVSFDVVDRSGKSILPRPVTGPVDLDKERRTVLTLELTTPYPGPGEYRLQVMVDGSLHFEAPYTLSVRPAERRGAGL